MSQPSIEDRVLIRELYDRYSWALDTGDLDGVRAAFAPGARIVARAPGGHAAVSETPEEVDETIRGWLTDPAVVGRQHHVTTLIVDADEAGAPDRRAVRTYFVVTELTPEPPSKVQWCGCSHDVVQHVDGQWRIAVRDVGLWEGDVLAGFALLQG